MERKLREILVIGAGGHATSCIDLIEKEGSYKIKALVGLPNEIGLQILGYEVKYSDKDLIDLSSKFELACNAIGQIKNPSPRREMSKKLEKFGFQLPQIISPTAYVSKHSSLGEGSMVFHNVTMNAGVSIGNHTILNSHSLLEHGVKIGDFTHVSTGVIVNGATSIGNSTFIGSGSVVGEGLKIGDKVIVGMGSRVLSDLPSGSVNINGVLK